MLLMVEKAFRDGICHAIYRYVKANNKYKKDYDKNKESLYLGTSTTYTDGQCRKSCLIVVLRGLKVHINLVTIL